MSKNAVRTAVFAIFNSHLPRRAELGNTGFHKAVIGEIMETFGCTLSSASTYYNTVFKQAKLATPELVEGLGRPGGKNNGGRKAKVLVSVVEKETGIVVAQGVSRNAAAEMIALANARNQPALEAVMMPEGVTQVVAETQQPETVETTEDTTVEVDDNQHVVINLVAQLVDTLLDKGEVKDADADEFAAALEA